MERLHGRDDKGTCIGLSIRKPSVESHGGRIWVESEAGVVVAFYFTVAADSSPDVN